LADVSELLGERDKAADWFIQLLSVVPTDAGVLRRLGQLCDADGSSAQAFHYFADSHRYDPNNIVVNDWLGRYYLESQLAEKVSLIDRYVIVIIIIVNSIQFIGPILWGHSAVPSVTRCRCCRCGHRFYIAIHQVSLLSHAACAIATSGFGSSW